MGGATRILMLLATPLPPRSPSLRHLARIHHHRYSHHLSSLSSHSLHHASQRRKASVPINCSHSQQFYSQTGTVRDDRQYLSDSYAPSSIGGHHLWPEWLNLLEILSTGGYLKEGLGSSVDEDSSKDEFVADVELSEEFARAARGCLAFARGRPHLFVTLARNDIKVLVENGTPFLFKNANDSILKMHCFLDGDKATGVGTERAQTIDLMRYILSYTCNPNISGETPENGRIVSSVRNLLRELASLCSPPTVSQFNSIDSTAQNQYPGGYAQVPKSHRQNIEMKRGDWLCPRCSFMNFARNPKCLECAETRPKRQLSGGEWECPQCDFHNYSRNVACLRCDCKRPAQLSGVPTGNYTSRDIDNRLSANEEKAQRWFNKVSQMDSSAADTNTAIADEDFPEIMPLRKGVNRFVVSTRKTPLERRLADAQRQRGSDNGSNNSSVEQGINSSYTPFVPLPADMFANKPASSGAISRETTVNKNEDVGLNSQEQISANRPEGGRIDKAQEGKTEGWFKRIVDLHDSPELTSATSDSDFPVRKEDNRFVVSKKEDRSLTNPMYKRQAAMEQTKSSNYVPFVPFPPDYFSNKEVKKSNNEAAVEKKASGEPPKQSNNVGASTPEMGQFQTSPPQPLNSSYSWTGKSLEGSAVKETDPLDMSEEAKAERWFRRVAQIKDISELSQIPDEDFPSIMPMRKGVNRFVVSKRKTPLERRLTSSQYRRNLPVVSSDPPKKEDDDRNQE